MLRYAGRSLLARATTALLATAHGLPEGFDFVDHKVVDKDVNANYEHLETLRLTLTRQDEFLLNERPVRCVTVTGTNGEHGIYPSHEYEIIKLLPSPILVEMADGAVHKYFTSGGFAHVNSEGSCDINCVECIPMKELDLESAEKALAEQNAQLSSSKDEKARSVVEIRVGVLESVISALKQHH